MSQPIQSADNLDTILSQVNALLAKLGVNAVQDSRSVSAAPVAETPTPVQAPPAASTPAILPSISVSPAFAKMPFTSFEPSYVKAKRAVHQFRMEMKASRRLQEADIQAPLIYSVMAHLEFLERVIQLMCACIPSSAAGPVVVPHGVARKTQDFIAELGRLHEPFGTVDASAVCASFNGAKSEFQTGRRALGSEPGKKRVSKKAYKAKTLEVDHFRVLVKFAKELTQVCRIMISNLVKPKWVSEECTKSVVVSDKYLSVVCPPKEIAPLTAMAATTTGPATDMAALRAAFKALDAQGKVSGYINNSALEKQKNEQAVVVYKALWYTILAMKNKWDVQALLTSVHAKLNGLTDDKCCAFKSKNNRSLSYVYNPLSSFWNSSSDSYKKARKLLTDETNAQNEKDKKEAKRFCVALLRYARAHTRVTAKRSADLVTWIQIVQRETAPATSPAIPVTPATPVVV